MGSCPFKLLVWAIFFDENVDQDTYQELLQVEFLHDLKVICHSHAFDRLRVMFMQDGTPAHYAKTTRDFLMHCFPGGVILRGENTFWPPHSPDLNVLGYYLWGKIKAKVTRKKYNNVENLKQSIREAFEGIGENTESTFNAVSQFYYRMKMVEQENGGHIEHLIKRSDSHARVEN